MYILNRIVNFKHFLPLLVGLLIVGMLPEGNAEETTIPVFVSILPQKYFVERVGGDHVTVSVMVGPGKNPHTFEPTPKLIMALSQARVYFRIGMSFENAWMNRISQTNPTMKIIDTRDRIPLRRMEAHSHENEISSEKDHDTEHEGDFDPHIWLNPRLVKIQAQTICNALAELDPGRREEFEHNRRQFDEELDRLDREIIDLFQNVRLRKFLVFHPAWGYFADAYELKEIPIEYEGKEPTAKQMTELIELVKKEKITTLFAQPQFDKRIASTIAKTIEGEVVLLDDLSFDYLKNLKESALKIQKAMQ